MKLSPGSDSKCVSMETWSLPVISSIIVTTCQCAQCIINWTLDEAHKEKKHIAEHAEGGVMWHFTMGTVIL